VSNVKILVLVQGTYGRRICEHVKAKGPPGWETTEVFLPFLTQPVLEEPEHYLPGSLGPADLVLHLGETHQAAQLLPAVTRAAGAGAVIAPISHSHWVPKGLRNQLRQELSQQGQSIVFPEPFCSLTEETAGLFPPVPYHHPLIRTFARHFGYPRLEVELSDDGQRLAKVEVTRSSPCGSSYHAAARLAGFDVSQVLPTAGLICLRHPCLASMALEERGGRTETIMHLAGQVFNTAMEEALSRRVQRTVHRQPVPGDLPSGG